MQYREVEMDGAVKVFQLSCIKNVESSGFSLELHEKSNCNIPGVGVI